MTITLLQVVAAARQREASVAAESGGYLVLAAADQVAVAPRRIALSCVELTEEGRVRLSGGEPCSEAAAERDLRNLLDEVLLVASSSTPALMRASRRSSGGGLSGLVREIEAALIPVNRAAAQRALARLARETQRALERGLEVHPEPEQPVLGEPAPAATALVEAEPAQEGSVELRVDAPVEWFVEPPSAISAPTGEPPASVEVEPDLVTVDVELPEPSEHQTEVETRPEPLLRRSVLPPSIPPPAPAGEHPETPRLGTLVAVATAPSQIPQGFSIAVPSIESASEVEPASEPEVTEPVAFTDREWDDEPSVDLTPGVALADDFASSDAILPVGESELPNELGTEAALEIGDELNTSGELEILVEPEFDEPLEPSVCIELRPELDPNLEPEPELPLELLEGPEPEPEPDLTLEPTPEPPPVPRIPWRREPMRSDVRDLVNGFQNEQPSSEPEIGRELRRLAGLEPTPPLPVAGDR